MKRFLTCVLAFGLSLPAVAASTSFQAQELIFSIEEVETPTQIAKKLSAATILPLINVEKQFQGIAGILDVNETDDGIEDLAGEVDITQVINYGMKIWEVIKANKPVVTQSYTYANALPQGVKNVFELEGSSPYQYRSFRLSAKNYLGFTVYNVLLTVAHQYGAAYQGKGAFITSAAIIPSEVDVLWGYTVDLAVKEISVSNVGTKADPIASLGLELNFHVYTPLKDSTFRQLVEFLGNSSQARLIR